MQSITKFLHKVLSALSITIFTLLILDVVLGVSSRYLFGGQIRWTEELATFLLVWQVFCGAAIAYHDKGHLGIDLLVNSLHPSARKISTLLTLAIVFCFTASVMVWGGSVLTLERLEAGQMMSTLGIQKAWLYLTVPLNGLFILCFNINMMVETLRTNSSEPIKEKEALA